MDAHDSAWYASRAAHMSEISCGQDRRAEILEIIDAEANFVVVQEIEYCIIEPRVEAKFKDVIGIWRKNLANVFKLLVITLHVMWDLVDERPRFFVQKLDSSHEF